MAFKMTELEVTAFGLRLKAMGSPWGNAGVWQAESVNKATRVVNNEGNIDYYRYEHVQFQTSLQTDKA